MPPTNVFAHGRTENEFADPAYSGIDPHSYAAPSEEEGSPYIRALGWAPSLRLSPVGTPDTSRLGTQPRREYRPDPVRPPDEFWQTIDHDRDVRYAVETQDADGWKETKEYPGYQSPSVPAYQRWAPNPRSIPSPEPRLTQQLSPRSYSYTRPFDQFNRGNDQDGPLGTTRQNNGQHFSMADHRRDYPILGMTPAPTRRNTYRIEPQPWDVDIVDVPPDIVQTEARVQAVDVPYGSRAWRL